MNFEPYRRVAYVGGGILFAWLWRSESPFIDYSGESDIASPIGLKELIYLPAKVAIRNDYHEVWGLAAATSFIALFIILIACWGAIRPNEPKIFSIALGEIMLASILTVFFVIELFVAAAEHQRSISSLFDIRGGTYLLFTIICLHAVAAMSVKMEDWRATN